MVSEDILKIVDDGILLKIRISPNASKNELIISDGICKLKITAQPIENKANKAVVEYLSKFFRLPKSSISIVRGDTSRDKTLLMRTNNLEKIESVKTLLSDVENL